MNEMRPSWDDLSLFLIVAREGGLAPASRVTQKSAATVGRRMLALERQLSRQLFTRTHEGYQLTQDGHILRDELSGIEGSLNQFYENLDHKRKPVVRISSGSWTTYRLMKNINAFQTLFDEVDLNFISCERFLSIAHREAVIGFRMAPPEDRGLAGRALNKVDFAVYAQENAPEQWVAPLLNIPSVLWLESQNIEPVLRLIAPRNVLDVLKQGVGQAILPTFIGDHEDDIIRRSDPIPELSHQSWLVTHDEDRHLPHVRKTIDIIYSIFSTAPEK